jgi:DNA-binding MarR family transcriptional regulator
MDARGDTGNDELFERAIAALPEIGKSLYAGFVRRAEAIGLTLGQAKAMSHLYRFGPCPVKDVAAGLGLALPTASEALDRLVEAGMVTREANPHDRRQVLVSLTPAAREVGARMMDLRRAQLGEVFARLEPAERPVFVRSLEVLADVLREDPTLWATGDREESRATAAAGATANVTPT